MSPPKTWRLGDFAAVRPEPMCGEVEVLWAVKGIVPELRPVVSMLSADDAEAFGKQLLLLGRAIIKASQDARANARAAA